MRDIPKPAQAKNLDCDREMRNGRPHKQDTIVGRAGKSISGPLDDLGCSVSVPRSGIMVARMPVQALITVSLVIPFEVLDDDTVFLLGQSEDPLTEFDLTCRPALDLH